ncbi:MAG: hypothetical protein ABR526_11350 [Chthoniobacterales bacterium]
MSWFRQNRFLGAFVAGLSVATISSAAFVWFAKSGFDEEKSRFDETAAELNRLQALTPFPTQENVAKMKAETTAYATQLTNAKEELKAHVLPVTPMAPNEFQARLRQAMAAVAERARANRVKLPDNFYLGFEEFAAALPDTAAAPSLSQQLAQVEMLVNILIDARVDAISSLKRVLVTEQRAASPSPTATPAGSPRADSKAPVLPPIERGVVDATFISNPAATRRAVNQISSANEQFYLIRTLHVLSEKDTGPARDSAAPAAASTTAAGAAALNFIVGNERIQTSARVEMLRFNFQP